MSTTPYKELFSSVVSDIKAYQGDDPLRPWLRGVRRMRQCLPGQILAEKLPRFLQKCAQAFESDRRYRNDVRYLRVWIQLMDHVDDPRGVLRRMEENQIGMKHAAYYVAYALYYEKQKKFEKAEKMFHAGVRKPMVDVMEEEVPEHTLQYNEAILHIKGIAEPAAELRKSYEQFLCRMKLSKIRRSKLNEARANATSKCLPAHQGEIDICKDDNSTGLKKAEQTQNEGRMTEVKGICRTYPSCKIGYYKNSDHLNMMEGQLSSAQETCEDTTKCQNVRKGKSTLKTHPPSVQHKGDVIACSYGLIDGDCISNTVSRITSDKASSPTIDEDLVKQNSFSSDDTVVVKFVGSAMVGKSEAEDACHHGLVDPTINMKEAINAINNMFREPIEPDPKLKRKSQQKRIKANPLSSNGFEVFIDENMNEGLNSVDQQMENAGYNAVQTALPMKHTEIEKSIPSVGIFKILADDDDDEYDHVDEIAVKNFGESSRLPVCHASVHPKLNKFPSGSCDTLDIVSSKFVKLKDDTVICNFVGSTVSGETEVENACHHGLVDPTINLKEAMDDINSMFGKPIDFVKASKLKKRADLSQQKQICHDFSILADEDLDLPTGKDSTSCFGESCRESDLFEPTVFTKEAMDEINKMFGKPLEF